MVGILPFWESANMLNLNVKHLVDMLKPERGIKTAEQNQPQRKLKRPPVWLANRSAVRQTANSLSQRIKDQHRTDLLVRRIDSIPCERIVPTGPYEK